jgi:hypothetical protein
MITTESEVGLGKLIPLIDGVSVIALIAGTAKCFDWFDGMLSDWGG